MSGGTPQRADVPESAVTKVKGRSVYTQVILVSLGALVPLLAALGILAYELDRMRGATLAVKAAYEAIEVSHRLQRQFAETQMAVHAYALTGDNSFVMAYSKGRREWSEAEVAASGSILQDPARAEQFIQIEAEVADFFMEWETRLMEIKPGSHDPATAALIEADRLRTRRIGRNIASFVEAEETAIRARLQDEERERNRAYVGTVVTCVLAVVLLGLFAALMGGAIARPIQQVGDAAQRLGEGDLSRRVVPHGAKETRVLAVAFNRMADALEETRGALAARNQQLEETAGRLAVLNEDLRDRQKEQEDFLYVLSHDLRAPLINIQGFTRRLHNSTKKVEENVADGAPPAESEKQFTKIGESLKFINAGSAKIDQLIARLLEIARINTRPNESEWIDMEAMARDVVSAVQFQMQEKHIEAKVNKLPYVFGDPIQLNQVLTNLVDNAIKYMGDGKVRQIAISCSPQGDRNRFEVSDTGPGISRENKEKIFRMFTRLSPSETSGEGIGLAAVRAIVNRHRGRIWVESVEGVGSTFYFTLPENVEGAPPMPEEAMKKNGSGFAGRRQADSDALGEENTPHA